MKAVRPHRRVTFVVGKAQVVGHLDALDHQHLPLQFHLANRFRGQPALAGRDPARFQRATQGAGQSTGCGGNQVVERGSVGFVDVGIDPIVLGYLGMNAKQYGLGLRGQIGPPQWALHALNANQGTVCDLLAHKPPPSV